MKTEFESSHPYTPLSEINKNRIDWNIRVRVCRKWRTTGVGKMQETLEFLFMDKDGTRIQATARKWLIELFEHNLNEGDLISVRQFSVSERQKNFAVADNSYRIYLQRNTLIAPVVYPRFPKSVFDFRSFTDIKDNMTNDDGPLFDIIGRVIDINDTKMKDDPSVTGPKSIQLYLEDLEQKTIYCTLWEPYCHELREFVDQVREKNLLDDNCVVVQMCRRKTFRNFVSVTNTYHATKVIVNQNLDEIVEFSAKLPLNDNNSRSFDGSLMSGSSSFLSIKDELQNSATVFLSLKDLKSNNVVGKFWIIASISEILYERGWCYTGCSRCKRKVIEQESKMYCETCVDYVVVVSKYKVHAKVVDGTDNVVVLLWNDIVANLIGKTAGESLSELIQDSIPDEDVERSSKDSFKLPVPQALEDLIGRELMFKVSSEAKQLEGREKEFVVDKYSDDDELIKSHRKTDHKILGYPLMSYKDSVDDNEFDVDQNLDGNVEEDFKSPVIQKRCKRVLEMISDDDDPIDEQGSISSKLKSD